VFIKADGALINANGRDLVANAVETMYGPTDAANVVAVALDLAVSNEVDYDSDDSDF
jgi:hypothetical protein